MSAQCLQKEGRESPTSSCSSETYALIVSKPESAESRVFFDSFDIVASNTSLSGCRKMYEALLGRNSRTVLRAIRDASCFGSRLFSQCQLEFLLGKDWVRQTKTELLRASQISGATRILKRCRFGVLVVRTFVPFEQHLNNFVEALAKSGRCADLEEESVNLVP